MNGLFLNSQIYTFYNAFSWGYCFGHINKVRESETFFQKFYHGSVAICESLPLVGQVASLFELSIRNLFTPTKIVKRNVQHNTLTDTLFPLHRQIETMYQNLPWPKSLKNIVVFTEVAGGRGDIQAAAKAIDLMQQFDPTLNFDWVLKGSGNYNPAAFLNSKNISKVKVRDWMSTPSNPSPGDFLLVGPVRFSYGVDYLENRIQRKISGPTFGFMEVAESLNSCLPDLLQNKAKQTSCFSSNAKVYQNLHPLAFPAISGNNWALLPMGLQSDSGLLLDTDRMDASLSLRYCCPSYLPHIEDTQLRKDILEEMNIFDGRSTPDFSQFSFNSGYAHKSSSWGKFIDCVAIHEKSKHVVIVLNQNGEFGKLSTDEFNNKIFQFERLKLLKEKGFNQISLKGENQSKIILSNEKGGSSRSLSVIIRPSFTPKDMKQMQLASERLLTTGDNSAIEAWCSRCKLYLYEDVANMGCKWRFLQQQVDLAKKFSHNLSNLLALFGGDRRLMDPMLNKPLSKEKMDELETILSDPDLSEATLAFCGHITQNYCFQKVLEGALKRAAWHSCLPELAQIEALGLDTQFQSELITYLQNPENRTENLIRIKNLPEIQIKIQNAVQKYTHSNSRVGSLTRRSS